MTTYKENINPYIGHDTQISGIEEHRLIGGKGDGVRILELNNGKGLEMTVVLDRAADISRLRYKGINIGYFSPCGYVAPSYYDSLNDHWLQSFTAGFLTTCGLESVGGPCVDQGEQLSMHGSISNIPADEMRWNKENESLIVQVVIRDEYIFKRKLKLEREIKMSLAHNSFVITDIIQNTGSKTEALEILYHMNMGYPLLDEDSILMIPAKQTKGRDKHAQEDIANCLIMEKPQADYKERCYYHGLKEGRVNIFQPKEKIGVEIKFDNKSLDCFTEWKMMGIRDYVLGLECGNCYPDGRDVMRNEGILKFIEPGEKIKYQIEVALYDENIDEGKAYGNKRDNK